MSLTLKRYNEKISRRRRKQVSGLSRVRKRQLQAERGERVVFKKKEVSIAESSPTHITITGEPVFIQYGKLGVPLVCVYAKDLNPEFVCPLDLGPCRPPCVSIRRIGQELFGDNPLLSFIRVSTATFGPVFLEKHAVVTFDGDRVNRCVVLRPPAVSEEYADRVRGVLSSASSCEEGLRAVLELPDPEFLPEAEVDQQDIEFGDIEPHGNVGDESSGFEFSDDSQEKEAQ